MSFPNTCVCQKKSYIFGGNSCPACTETAVRDKSAKYAGFLLQCVWQSFNFMSRSSNCPQPSAMAWNDQSGQQNCSSLCDQVLKYLANHRKFCKTAVKKMQGIVCQARPEGPLACLAGPQLPPLPHLVMAANDLSECSTKLATFCIVMKSWNEVVRIEAEAFRVNHQWHGLPMKITLGGDCQGNSLEMNYALHSFLCQHCLGLHKCIAAYGLMWCFYAHIV